MWLKVKNKEKGTDLFWGTGRVTSGARVTSAVRQACLLPHKKMLPEGVVEVMR
jgi:hypothetical protein